jgi:FkbM family methyltransferase
MRRNWSAEAVASLYSPLANVPDVSEVYEEIIAALYMSRLRSGDRCVDGGAHVGRHTIPMARLVGTGKVHAYEPIAETARSVVEHAKREGLLDRIELRHTALADSVGRREYVSFYDPLFPLPRSAYSGLRKGWTPENYPYRTITTDVTTLDRDLSGTDNLSFIKLDLEGGEFHALRGAENTIRSSRPLIAFENTRSGSARLYEYSADDFYGLFERLHYSVSDILGSEVTRDKWEWSPPMPFYCIAFPLELSSRLIDDSINEVLRRHALSWLILPQ